MTEPELQREQQEALDEHDLVSSARVGADGPVLRVALPRGQVERNVRLDDVDDVIGIACELRDQDADTLTIADMKDVGLQLDIEAAYIENAIVVLEGRRAKEKAVALERETRLAAARTKRNRALAYGAGVLAALMVLLGGFTFSRVGTLTDLHLQVKQHSAQVASVRSRQTAVQIRWQEQAATGTIEGDLAADRAAELAGAENRVRIAIKRLNEASTAYNSAAAGPLSSVAASWGGLPAHVTLSP